MGITEADVRHVAMLAHIALSDDQVRSLAAELDGLLVHIDELSRIDVDDVKPTAHPLSITNRTRPDVVVPGLSRAEALRNAPETEGASFVVPAIGSQEDAS